MISSVQASISGLIDIIKLREYTRPTTFNRLVNYYSTDYVYSRVKEMIDNSQRILLISNSIGDVNILQKIVNVSKSLGDTDTLNKVLLVSNKLGYPTTIDYIIGLVNNYNNITYLASTSSTSRLKTYIDNFDTLKSLINAGQNLKYLSDNIGNVDYYIKNIDSIRNLLSFVSGNLVKLTDIVNNFERIKYYLNEGFTLMGRMGYFVGMIDTIKNDFISLCNKIGSDTNSYVNRISSFNDYFSSFTDLLTTYSNDLYATVFASLNSLGTVKNDLVGKLNTLSNKIDNMKNKAENYFESIKGSINDIKSGIDHMANFFKANSTTDRLSGISISYDIQVFDTLYDPVIIKRGSWLDVSIGGYGLVVPPDDIKFSTILSVSTAGIGSLYGVLANLRLKGFINIHSVTGYFKAMMNLASILNAGGSISYTVSDEDFALKVELSGTSINYTIFDMLDWFFSLRLRVFGKLVVLVSKAFKDFLIIYGRKILIDEIKAKIDQFKNNFCDSNLTGIRSIIYDTFTNSKDTVSGMSSYINQLYNTFRNDVLGTIINDTSNIIDKIRAMNGVISQSMGDMKNILNDIKGSFDKIKQVIS